MSWADVAADRVKGAMGKVANFLGGGPNEGGGAAEGGGGAGAASAASPPPPALRPVVMVDVVLVAVTKRDALAGGVRLRVVGASGLEGDPVLGQPLPGSAAAHSVVQFTARAPEGARQLRFTFVGGGEARERGDDRSTFVRVADLTQPAAAAGIAHAFLGFVDLEGGELLGLRHALAAYARHALQAHLPRQQPLQVSAALACWRAIVVSLGEEKMSAARGARTALLGGRGQRGRVEGAARIAAQDLAQDLAKAGGTLHCSRAAFCC